MTSSLFSKLNATSIAQNIDRFRNNSLQAVLEVNTETKFLDSKTLDAKYCYQMSYDTLTFTAKVSLDAFEPTPLGLRNSYVTQAMHSLSGEQNDLCLYTYHITDLIKFLEKNKHLHYTFLPITVHATESANGYRHDMMLIFDNKTHLFYWFDSGNRLDYLQHGNNIPKNAIDLLFINMAEYCKLGYSYEPTPSWMIQGICQPSVFDNQLDFVMSTAWCYLVVLMLNGSSGSDRLDRRSGSDRLDENNKSEEYNSPTEMLSSLDTMSKEDLFHLLYSAAMNLIGSTLYLPTINKNAQVNLCDLVVKVPPNTPQIYNAPCADVDTVQGLILPGVLVTDSAQQAESSSPKNKLVCDESKVQSVTPLDDTQQSAKTREDREDNDIMNVLLYRLSKEPAKESDKLTEDELPNSENKPVPIRQPSDISNESSEPTEDDPLLPIQRTSTEESR